MIGQVFNAKEFTKKLKATIQATGKLGFTADTISQLQLTTDCSILIAPDSDDSQVLYMAVLRTIDESAFAVLKSGSYLYLNTKQLFDRLCIRYTKSTVMFDLSRFQEGDSVLGGECYKMTMRANPKKASVSCWLTGFTYTSNAFWHWHIAESFLTDGQLDGCPSVRI